MKIYDPITVIRWSLIALVAVHLGCFNSSGLLVRFTENDQNVYKKKIITMFYEAYNGYLANAIDYDELMPITCAGMNTWGTFSLSMIDALDMLVIVGNHSEFNRVAQYVLDTADFDTNTNVSVFETNIRVVGGLLSAHLFSRRAGFRVESGWPCSGPLLRLAEKVARKLLPAFNTTTGMPYGTINFRYGVPENETPVTCTAGVGTFIVEFGTLSRLTGDPIFEQTALNALDALQRHRSKIGLLGNHINVQDGKWTATDAGIGAGVDSYFEYLVKGSILLQMPSLMEVFKYDYDLIKSYFRKNDWFIWVSMASGAATMPMYQSLESFFPGLLTLIGDLDQAKKTLYNYHQIWKQYGFVPEFYDILNGKHHKRDGYPLRPEFAESVYYLYQATRDPHLLSIGADIIDSIHYSARTECGYATIKSVLDHTIEDRMESFFLAETLKYLYLLFDSDNFINEDGSEGIVVNVDGDHHQCIVESGGYVFNTEAHPVDIATLSCCTAIHSDFQDGEFEDNLNLYDLFVLNRKSPNFERRNRPNLVIVESADQSIDQTLVQQTSEATMSTATLQTPGDHVEYDQITPTADATNQPPTTTGDGRIYSSFNEQLSIGDGSAIKESVQFTGLQPSATPYLTIENQENETHCTQTLNLKVSDDRLTSQMSDYLTLTIATDSNTNQFHHRTTIIPSIKSSTLLNETIMISTGLNDDGDPSTIRFNSSKSLNFHELTDRINEFLNQQAAVEAELVDNFEHFSCPSQSFYIRLSLYGQMFV